jgi:hypothetical protein
VKHLKDTRGTVKVDYDPAEVTVEAIVKATERSNHNYRVAVGDPKDVPIPTEEIDCRIISSGGRFRIEENLAKGKLTVVDFYVDDRAGRDMDAWLSTLAKVHGFARRRILAEPDSSALKQAKELFKIEKLPYLRIYGRDGAFLTAILSPDRDLVEAELRGRK